MGIGFFIISFILFLDQITKFCILQYAECLPLKITPFFNLVLIWNRGISFGLFNVQTPWVFWAITTLAILVVCILFALLWRAHSFLTSFAFSLVIGGAVGNIVDRLTRGGVVDFLDFHLYNYHWPAFNIADSAVVAGVLLLMIGSYFDEKKSRF